MRINAQITVSEGQTLVGIEVTGYPSSVAESVVERLSTTLAVCAERLVSDAHPAEPEERLRTPNRYWLGEPPPFEDGSDRLLRDIEAAGGGFMRVPLRATMAKYRGTGEWADGDEVIETTTGDRYAFFRAGDVVGWQHVGTIELTPLDICRKLAANEPLMVNIGEGDPELADAIVAVSGIGSIP